MPVLARLGVSHLYLSPPFSAVEGSTHGYDVVDPNAVDHSLGDEADVVALAAELHAVGMGLLLDIVPNHMAASPQNPAWRELLARGPRAASASMFDVDLGALGGKVLLPVLGAPLDDELEAGTVRLAVEDGRVAVRYHDLALPVAEATAAAVLGEGPERWNQDREGLRSLLEAQPYVLEHWRDEGRRRNYRRFFDITDLVGVRQQDARVFRATHALVTEWVRAQVVDGLRVDHVDGLRDPAGYLERVRERIGPPWLLVEKILARDEELPSSWPVDGTTGYEAANDLNDLFVDPRGWRKLGRVAATFRGGTGREYGRIRADARRLVLRALFGAEVDQLTRALARLSRSGAGRPPTTERIREALVETTAELDVYRTYVRDGDTSASDRRRIGAALRRAGAVLGSSHRSALSVLRAALLGRVDPAERRAAAEIVARWQQLTGPVAAKGEEDTALYRDVRLVARNEVGADPGLPPRPAAEIHHRLRARGRRWPGTLIATSTHDTKRGEEVRTRIDVLSEIPEEWRDRVEGWSERNGRFRRGVGEREAPSAAEELLLYQTLVGAWPLRAADRRGFGERIRGYLEKALREAKVHSSWLDPDEPYERAVFAFARSILARSNAAFVDDLDAFARRVAFHGAMNSLAQVVLKAIVPGVPDVYQGSEGWNLRLVDPDNRVPVDMDALDRRLARIERSDPERLLADWPSGDVKLFVTARALRLRRERQELFSADARYVPVAATGRHADRVVAAARHGEDGSWILAVAPRFTTGLSEAPHPPVGRVWGKTSLDMPTTPRVWREVFTGEEVTPRPARGRTIEVAHLLRRFPVAILSEGGD